MLVNVATITGQKPTQSIDRKRHRKTVSKRQHEDNLSKETSKAFQKITISVQN